jgi:hypothetical protein
MVASPTPTRLVDALVHHLLLSGCPFKIACGRYQTALNSHSLAECRLASRPLSLGVDGRLGDHALDKHVSEESGGTRSSWSETAKDRDYPIREFGHFESAMRLYQALDEQRLFQSVFPTIPSDVSRA